MPVKQFVSQVLLLAASALILFGDFAWAPSAAKFAGAMLSLLLALMVGSICVLFYHLPHPKAVRSLVDTWERHQKAVDWNFGKVSSLFIGLALIKYDFPVLAAIYACAWVSGLIALTSAQAAGKALTESE